MKLAVDVPKLALNSETKIDVPVQEKTPELLQLQSGGIKTSRRLLGIIAAKEDFALKGSSAGPETPNPESCNS